MLLDFRKPDCTIEEKCTSYSGKYMGFYGIHYHEGRACYVVGVSDKTNGAITMRHYNEKNNVNQDAAKWAARQYWQKTLKPGLEKAPEAEESEDDTAAVAAWLERFDNRASRLKKLN